MEQPRKAVALISGGLDSMLAAKVVLEQGVRVEGLNFFTGFCVEGHTHAIRKQDRARPKRNNALWVAEQLGIKLHFVDVVEEYKPIVLNPRHGYGANLNPCLDCKSFMVGRANEWRRERGFDFIVTGEVVGQRPMSQRRDTMPVVARESGAGDRLLRPLCAKRLDPTLPEREGWVDRERLHDFHGRSRKPQMALAESFGFTRLRPARGRLLLPHQPPVRLEAHRTSGRAGAGATTTSTTSCCSRWAVTSGPRPHFKLIVAREEGENRYLEGYRKRFTHLRTTSHQGPLTLVDGAGGDDLLLAARMTARFSQGRDADRVTVEIVECGGESRTLEVAPLNPDEIPSVLVCLSSGEFQEPGKPSGPDVPAACKAKACKQGVRQGDGESSADRLLTS